MVRPERAPLRGNECDAVGYPLFCWLSGGCDRVKIETHLRREGWLRRGVSQGIGVEYDVEYKNRNDKGKHHGFC